MLSSRNAGFGLALTVGALLLAAHPAAAQSGTILGGYSGDTPVIVINNTGSVDFTQASLTGTYGSATSVENIGTIAAGKSFTASGGSTPFAFDPDDSMGEFPLTFSALAGSNPISVTFSPSNNSTGQFVDFEGTGPDNDFAPAKVADINAVPEPSAVASMGFGVLGLGTLMLRARKRRAVAA